MRTFLKIFIVFAVLACMSSSVFAVPNMEKIFMQELQKSATKQQLPDNKNDKYFNIFTFKFEGKYVTAQIDSFGGVMVNEREVGNIHVPVTYDGEFCESLEGTYAIIGDRLVRFYYGQPVAEVQLSETLPRVKMLRKYYDEFFLVLAADNNVYTVEVGTGIVHQLTTKENVEKAELSNFLPCEHVQISIVTSDGDWYTTENVYSGDWELQTIEYVE